MNIDKYMIDLGRRARPASRAMARASTAAKNAALAAVAQAIERDAALLKDANARDLARARDKGHDAAFIDRLTLSDKALKTMVEGLRQVAGLADPIGEISGLKYRPSGIQVGQMRVPLGVIGIIYESRPNVTMDAAALCLKSGNAAILRGGSEALECKRRRKLIGEGLEAAGLPQDAVQVVATADRAAVGKLITMTEYVDVMVPRGGKSLIARLMEEARVPMIKHLDGICHVYVDDRADLVKALAVCDNAKTHRYGTCNTMETLLVARGIASEALPALARAFQARKWSCASMPRPVRCWKRRRSAASSTSGKKTGAPNISRRCWRSRWWTTSTKPSTHQRRTARITPTRSSPKITTARCVSCAKSIRRA